MAAGVHTSFQDNMNELLWFNKVANITFTEGRLLDIQTDQPSILTFTRCNNITVNNLTSSGCSASGAILTSINATGNSDDNPPTNFVVTQSNFSASQAGAISIQNSAGYLTATIIDNVVPASGVSAVSVLNEDGSAFAVSGCTFSNIQAPAAGPNTPFQSADAEPPPASALYIMAESLTIGDSTFTNNTALQGAAIYLDIPADLDNNPTSHIVRNVFQSNFALYYGGAVFVSGSSGAANELVTVDECQVHDCASVFSGAFTTFGVAQLVIANSSFTGSAKNRGSLGASAVYVYGLSGRFSSAVIVNSVFSNIASIASETLVRLFTCKCVGVLNSTFASSGSSGLYIEDVSGSCEVDAKNDRGIYNAGVLFLRDTVVTGAGSPDASNEISQALGGDVSSQISVDIRASSFLNNTIHIQNTSADPVVGFGAVTLLSVRTVLLSEVTASGNTGRQGAAIHLDAIFALVIWNSTFMNNSAAYEGGAVAMVNSHGPGIWLGATHFSGNSAWRGGAIYGSLGTKIIIAGESTLENNTAATRGGAVYCAGSSQVKMQDCVISGNNANDAGGGCYCDACQELLVNSARVSYNR